MKVAALVLGGGFAGTAAATRLAEAGVRVALVERKNRLGGRASSFHDPRAGQAVDNGQHLFMGCYRHARALLRRIGTEGLIDFPDRVRVDYADARGLRTAFSCPAWPGPPLSLALGLLGLGGVSLSEKLGLGRFDRFFRRNGASFDEKALDAVTVAGWLDSLGQSRALQERFFFPAALGILNELPNRASALGFVQALREIFFTGAQSMRFGLARAGLGELTGEAAVSYIKERGGTVFYGKRIASVSGRAGAFTAVTDRGERFEAGAVVSALSCWDLARVELPDALADAPWRALRPSPIVGLNLWLDRPVLDEPFVGMLGTEVHWAFNRSRLWGLAGPGQVLALTISGAHDALKRAPEEIFESARGELAACFPDFKKAKLVRWTVVKEPFATLSPVVGSDALRPGVRTPVPGLLLAGDWTKTGLPATIESAAKSGHAAAEEILEGR